MLSLTPWTWDSLISDLWNGYSRHPIRATGHRSSVHTGKALDRECLEEALTILVPQHPRRPRGNNDACEGVQLTWEVDRLGHKISQPCSIGEANAGCKDGTHWGSDSSVGSEASGLRSLEQTEIYCLPNTLQFAKLDCAAGSPQLSSIHWLPTTSYMAHSEPWTKNLNAWMPVSKYTPRTLRWPTLGQSLPSYLVVASAPCRRQLRYGWVERAQNLAFWWNSGGNPAETQGQLKCGLLGFVSVPFYDAIKPLSARAALTKIPQTGRLIHRHLFLAVLEPGGLRSGCQPGPVLGRAFFRRRGPASAVSSRGRGPKRKQPPWWHL